MVSLMRPPHAPMDAGEIADALTSSCRTATPDVGTPKGAASVGRIHGSPHSHRQPPEHTHRRGAPTPILVRFPLVWILPGGPRSCPAVEPPTAAVYRTTTVITHPTSRVSGWLRNDSHVSRETFPPGTVLDPDTFRWGRAAVKREVSWRESRHAGDSDPRSATSWSRSGSRTRRTSARARLGPDSPTASPPRAIDPSSWSLEAPTPPAAHPRRGTTSHI